MWFIVENAMRRRLLSLGFASAIAATGCSGTVSIETPGAAAGAGGSEIPASNAIATSGSSAASGGGGGPAVKIALGGFHTCALKEDGSLWCWGDNQYGELGVGTACSAPPNQVCGTASPVEVTALGHGVRDVALGSYGHSCALKTDGSLWCWGRNDRGQLGDGTTFAKSSPVKVAALANIVKVALGEGHSCALRTDGSLWCWGGNEDGEIGDGTVVDKHTPAQVTALGSEVVDLAVGDGSSFARKKDGSFWAWGLSATGQLGLGTACPAELWPCVMSPVEVTTLGNDVVELALGGTHGCARRKEASVSCWGDNYWGAVGDGTVVDKIAPVAVGDLGGGIVQLALGRYNSCARKADGMLLCWGGNGRGQLGTAIAAMPNCQMNGLFVPCSTKPFVVPGLTGVVEVAVGDGHVCVRRTDASLWCWGDNAGGQLGDGTMTNRPTPAPVNW